VTSVYVRVEVDGWQPVSGAPQRLGRPSAALRATRAHEPRRSQRDLNDDLARWPRRGADERDEFPEMSAEPAHKQPRGTDVVTPQSREREQCTPEATPPQREAPMGASSS